MTRFESFKRIRNVEFAATMMYEIAQTCKTQEEIRKHLQSEIGKEHLFGQLKKLLEQDLSH
jgi:hypothetical protein